MECDHVITTQTWTATVSDKLCPMTAHILTWGGFECQDGEDNRGMNITPADLEK